MPRVSFSRWRERRELTGILMVHKALAKTGTPQSKSSYPKRHMGPIRPRTFAGYMARAALELARDLDMDLIEKAVTEERRL